MYEWIVNVAVVESGRLTHHFRVRLDSSVTREHAFRVARELGAAYPDGEVTLTRSKVRSWETVSVPRS